MDFINIFFTPKFIIDLLGWIGGVALVLAFYLNSTGKITSTGTKYQLLNFIAAIFLIINTAYYGAYPSAFVNVIWSFIAIYSLWKSSSNLNNNTVKKEK